jgi:hypothetical protein
MIGTNDEDKLVPGNDEAFQAFAFNRAFDKAEFRRAALDRFGDLSCIADRQPDLDARVARAPSVTCPRSATAMKTRNCSSVTGSSFNLQIRSYRIQ